MSNKAAVALGRRGGKAGTGKSKRRGDAEYYRLLATRSAEARKKNRQHESE